MLVSRKGADIDNPSEPESLLHLLGAGVTGIGHLTISFPAGDGAQDLMRAGQEGKSSRLAWAT